MTGIMSVALMWSVPAAARLQATALQNHGEAF